MVRRLDGEALLHHVLDVVDRGTVERLSGRRVSDELQGAELDDGVSRLRVIEAHAKGRAAAAAATGLCEYADRLRVRVVLFDQSRQALLGEIRNGQVHSSRLVPWGLHTFACNYIAKSSGAWEIGYFRGLTRRR